MKIVPVLVAALAMVSCRDSVSDRMAMHAPLTVRDAVSATEPIVSVFEDEEGQQREFAAYADGRVAWSDASGDHSTTIDPAQIDALLRRVQLSGVLQRRHAAYTFLGFDFKSDGVEVHLRDRSVFLRVSRDALSEDPELVASVPDTSSAAAPDSTIPVSFGRLRADVRSTMSAWTAQGDMPR